MKLTQTAVKELISKIQTASMESPERREYMKELWSRYEKMIYSSIKIFSSIHKPGTYTAETFIDEAFSNTYLKLHKSINSLIVDEADDDKIFQWRFQKWLKLVIKSVLIDICRKEKAITKKEESPSRYTKVYGADKISKEVPHDETLTQLSLKYESRYHSPYSNPFQNVVNVELNKNLKDALIFHAKCNPRSAKALFLRFYKEMKIRELVEFFESEKGVPSERTIYRLLHDNLLEMRSLTLKFLF